MAAEAQEAVYDAMEEERRMRDFELPPGSSSFATHAADLSLLLEHGLVLTPAKVIGFLGQS